LAQVVTQVRAKQRSLSHIEEGIEFHSP